MARRGPSEDPKVTALRESRCLNPHPEQVTDEAFLAADFFDARDAVQVKYEMVRRVTVEGAPVTATAAAFGYSRPAYYQAAAALAESGLDGLVPAKPGPRGGHKLTGEILAWAEQQLAADPGLRPASLAERPGSPGPCRRPGQPANPARGQGRNPPAGPTARTGDHRAHPRPGRARRRAGRHLTGPSHPRSRRPRRRRSTRMLTDTASSK